MKTKVYCVKDTKATFWKPHVQLNDLVARREFDNMINAPDNSFPVVNYADLELYRVGTFDDATGVITSEVEFICSGVDVKKGVE